MTRDTRIALFLIGELLAALRANNSQLFRKWLVGGIQDLGEEVVEEVLLDWTNPARPKLDGEYVKPKKALVWVAWSVERQRPELLILEQRSLRDGIVEALGDEDFGFSDDGTAGFLLKVSRRGTGLDTSYSVLPKTKEPTKVETNGMSTVADLTVTSLLDGGHPFVKAAAEFKTEATTEEAEF